jgi:hypothetical protein
MRARRKRLRQRRIGGLLLDGGGELLALERGDELVAIERLDARQRDGLRARVREKKLADKEELTGRARARPCRHVHE